MLRLAVFCAIAITCGLAATIMPPKPTHAPHGSHATLEPGEHETYKFAYEPRTHLMVVASGHNCYILTLSDAEQTSVHTDSGLRAIELKSLGLISTGTQTMTTKDNLDAHVVHVCGAHITNYFTVA
ncbi:uncharacterized protein LOC128212914 [Mya arenaria]|uniref:uncharacterized protein LOC128212914 n=1 Tax=Mya arenaria TaxID=6604 RepID=UPI0022E53D6A|nr:uncharacterized protein LOC128212914 [Mya arenaria]